jgi:hypothetical protein
MWRVAVARRRLRAMVVVIPRLQAAVRAWKVRANAQAVREEAQRQRHAAVVRQQRRLRIEHQRRELELLKAMKGRSEHVRARVRTCLRACVRADVRVRPCSLLRCRAYRLTAHSWGGSRPAAAPCYQLPSRPARALVCLHTVGRSSMCKTCGATRQPKGCKAGRAAGCATNETRRSSLLLVTLTVANAALGWPRLQIPVVTGATSLVPQHRSPRCSSRAKIPGIFAIPRPATRRRSSCRRFCTARMQRVRWRWRARRLPTALTGSRARQTTEATCFARQSCTVTLCARQRLPQPRRMQRGRWAKQLASMATGREGRKQRWRRGRTSCAGACSTNWASLLLPVPVQVDQTAAARTPLVLLVARCCCG